MPVTPAGFKNGKIILDEPRGVFYPGQIISGKVHFRLMSTIAFGAIKIQYLGVAFVKWSEIQTKSSNGESHVMAELCQGRDEYFNHTQVLSGGNGTSELPPGEHTFPFSYQLPFNIPSSFSGDKGCIQYSIIASIEYSDSLMDMETMSRLFEIIGALDLNVNPTIKKPLVLELEEMYSSCCCLDCGSVPVTVTVRLPVSGYCPGQEIEATVDVNNKSNYEIKRILFQLISRVKYHSQRPESDYVPPEQVLAKTKRGPIMSGVQRHFTCHLLVPDIVAPNLEFCAIIKVHYFIKVTVSMTGCNDDMWDEVEICLGLIPLEADKESYKHPMQHSLPTGPVPTPGTAQVLPSTDSNTGFKVTDNLESNLPYPYPTNIPTNTPYSESFYPSAGVMPYPSTDVMPHPSAGYMPHLSPGDMPHPSAGDMPHHSAKVIPYPSAGDMPHPSAGDMPHHSVGDMPHHSAGYMPQPSAGDMPHPSAGDMNPPYPTGLNMSHPLPSAHIPYPTSIQNPNDDDPPPYSSVVQSRPHSPYKVTPSAPPPN